ncbi:Hypothetical protein NCS54_00157100 [Fusarium falciforme]|nr:Hypothetical protein NCS54_00157100 [Fusarium falciforme]WAO84360.1 Hypothetical protein NCS54_00157100 [Fusarium falciforme]
MGKGAGVHLRDHSLPSLYLFMIMAFGSFLRSLLSGLSTSVKPSHVAVQKLQKARGSPSPPPRTKPQRQRTPERDLRDKKRARVDTWSASSSSRARTRSPRETQVHHQRARDQLHERNQEQQHQHQQQQQRARDSWSAATATTTATAAITREASVTRNSHHGRTDSQHRKVRESWPASTREPSATRSHGPSDRVTRRHTHAPSTTTTRRDRSQSRHGTNRLLYSASPASNMGVVSATDRAMPPDIVREVINLIAARFSHIPYAVSGHAAMAYYGYDVKPFKVSIICPEHTRKPLKGWARTHDMLPIPGKTDIWGIPTSDGLFRQVRVRFPYDFGSAHIVKEGPTAAAVLSLPGLADELARTYVNELKHADLRRQESLGKELMWVLRRISTLKHDDHWLKPERAPHLVQDRFWLPFSLSYPASVPLFAAAGWSIPNAESWCSP